MELNFLQSILFGLISGIAEILPVSAQAHKTILLKIFGAGSEPGLLRLILHMSTLAGLYYGCHSHIARMLRAQKMAKRAKNSRRRPLDMRSVMDMSLFKTTLIPVILGFLFYNKLAPLSGNMTVIAAFLFLNGVILYIPQFLPGSNRDARSMSRVDGLLLGLGGALSTIPGISCTGTVSSIGLIRGAEQNYGFSMALLIQIPVTIGLIVFDLAALVNAGVGTVSFGILLGYLLAAGACFAGVVFAVKLMQKLVASIGMSYFAMYCWGAALFIFIFYLTAA